MKRAKRIPKKTTTQLTICQEKIACERPDEIAVVKCKDCNTLQCSSCELELHKDGDDFFHERVPVDDSGKTTSVPKPTAYSAVAASKPHTSANEGALRPSEDLVLTDRPGPTTESCEAIKNKPTDKPTVDEKPGTGKGFVKSPEDSPVDRLASLSFKDAQSTLDAELEAEFGSNDFHSLSLDSILNKEIVIDVEEFETSTKTDMRGPSKKSKKKGSSKSSSSKGSDSDIPQENGSSLSINTEYFNPIEVEPVPKVDTEASGDEDIVSDLMQSMTETHLKAALVEPPQPLREDNRRPTSREPVLNGASRVGPMINGTPPNGILSDSNQSDSFLLIDETESIKVRLQALHVYTRLLAG